MQKPRPIRTSQVKPLGFCRPFRVGYINERIDDLHRKGDKINAIGFLAYEDDENEGGAWAKRKLR
jgi:hypothetical protein